MKINILIIFLSLSLFSGRFGFVHRLCDGYVLESESPYMVACDFGRLSACMFAFHPAYVSCTLLLHNKGRRRGRRDIDDMFRGTRFCVSFG